MDSLQLATQIAHIMDKKKAANLKVLKVRDLTVLTDYYVIANGGSTTQVKSLAEEVEFQLGQQDIKPLRTEGYDSKSWILLDYGNVIVHVFCPEARNYYDLDHLWADGEEIELDLDEEPVQE